MTNQILMQGGKPPAGSRPSTPFWPLRNAAPVRCEPSRLTPGWSSNSSVPWAIPRMR